MHDPVMQFERGQQQRTDDRKIATDVTPKGCICGAMPFAIE
jgi:hypothetical protein